MPFALPPHAPFLVCLGHPDSGHWNAICWMAQSPHSRQEKNSLFKGDSNKIIIQRLSFFLSIHAADILQKDESGESKLKKCHASF